MKKSDVVKLILGNQYLSMPAKNKIVRAFAPSNIALIKYWGKRNRELNLPVTSSLSISLDQLGSEIELSVNDLAQDMIFLNDHSVDLQTDFAKRMLEWINLFRLPNTWFFKANIKSTVPIAAGLASSACGFASLAKAMNQLLEWQLNLQDLSIFARLGSGSACRSLWNGLVEWQCGQRADGMDSFARPLNIDWPELSLHLLILNAQQKSISSRVAMQRTVATSLLYQKWPEQVAADLSAMHTALQQKDFELLGKTAETNALAMHATMRDAHPAVDYCLPETHAAMQKVWKLRAEGLPVYFTQDAGPNLKLLFLQKEADTIKKYFPSA